MSSILKFHFKVDNDLHIESAWYAGGMIPPENVKRYRRGLEWTKKYENDPVNRLMVYQGSPMVSIRSQLPLNTIVPITESENPDLVVPFFKFDPRAVGTKTDHRHMANIPGNFNLVVWFLVSVINNFLGFWPGDPYRFGILSYNKRGHMLGRQERYKDPQDDKEALHRQGILASFGWLSAQANFLGFTTFNDITYPLVTQTVITNGKLWSFYVYQMNTMLLHSKYITENPKTNICWATEELKLYEDLQDGKIVGFNEDVLKMILKLYANAPESRLGVNMTPYLSSSEKVSADYEDDEKRTWLEREYKFLVANRPRYKQVDEVYPWEKIYKIDHNSRFMDKRLRPFEKFIQPYQRRLDDRRPVYIPRKHRPDLPRWKGRYAKEFFP